MQSGHRIEHHHIELEGIRCHYALAGSGPLVVLVHGFPELWYSWREQLSALAAAGFRAVAPDLRGFGESSVPERVEDYSLLEHGADIQGLIAALGEQRAVLVGHDWGANLVWLMALRYPQLVRAVVALSVPFYPEPRDPSAIKAFASGHFNFMQYFQRPGAVEAEFERDPRGFLRRFFYGLSGDAPRGTVEHLFQEKPANATLMDGFPAPPAELPWLRERDLDRYVSAFERTGLSGALGFYRNLERDYPALKEIYRHRLEQPVLFLGGAEEPTLRFGSLDPMRRSLPNLRQAIVLPGCGHWVQQERAAAVNEALVAFLKDEVEGTRRSS